MTSEPLTPQTSDGAIPTVLVLEDEPTSRHMMRFSLESCGYAAIEAETVDRAVAALSRPINAAVLDVQLAGDRSGLEVLIPLRGRPELANVPVVVLTGGVLTDAEEEQIKQQHAYVFYKPEGCDTIVAFLDRLTGRRANPPREVVSFAQLRKDFLAQVESESCFLRTYLPTGLELQRARQILHRWTGIAGTLGFGEISRHALDLQMLLDDVSTGDTAERLRVAVEKIATLGNALGNVPVEKNPLPDSVARCIAGRKVALVGFEQSTGTWMTETLQHAGAVARVFDSGEVVAGSCTLASFELVAIPASFHDGAFAGGDVVIDAHMPVLIAGPIESMGWWTPALPDSLHDFLITPCEPEELLLRTFRLLSGAGSHVAGSRDATSNHRPCVIVADDDLTITSLVRAVLQNYDFECHIARDGGQALQLTKRLRPDALVLDVNMPQFDGFEVLDAVKNDPATTGVAVVMLSARQQEADIMRGFALGADDYVVKPFSPIELIARIKRLLRKRAA